MVGHGDHHNDETFTFLRRERLIKGGTVHEKSRKPGVLIPCNRAFRVLGGLRGRQSLSQEDFQGLPDEEVGQPRGGRIELGDNFIHALPNLWGVTVHGDMNEDQTELRPKRLGLEKLGFEVLNRSLGRAKEPELVDWVREFLINLVPEKE